MIKLLTLLLLSSPQIYISPELREVVQQLNEYKAVAYIAKTRAETHGYSTTRIRLQDITIVLPIVAGVSKKDIDNAIEKVYKASVSIAGRDKGIILNNLKDSMMLGPWMDDDQYDKVLLDLAKNTSIISPVNVELVLWDMHREGLINKRERKQ